MRSVTQFILTVTVYSGIVVLVCLYATKPEQKAPYDKYLVALEGTVLKSNNLANSLQFYTEVLEFNQIEKQKADPNIVGFRFGDKRNLFIEYSNLEKPIDGSLVLFRVRNGIEKLQDLLKNKLQASRLHEGYIEDARDISEVMLKPWGTEFYITDPTHNKLIFYEPKRRSALRIE